VKDVKEFLLKTGAFGEDIKEQYINQYFTELDKELSNDLSTIYREDFVQQWQVHMKTRNQQQHNLQNQSGTNEDSSGDRKRKTSGTTEPPTQPPKRSKTTFQGLPPTSNSIKPEGAQEPPALLPEASAVPPTPQVPPPNPESVLGPDTGIETKARDEKARQEERKGVLTSTVISNDRVPQHMIWLTTLKNIFAKQLPKMPKDYIVRLVFDRNHRSLCLLKNNNVVGGITFRPFHSQGFLEIAFCAIMSSEQVKGYGTHLMNHVKNYALTIGVFHFLTYADNYAIGYFRKQGFTKTIHLPRKNWLGFIKDYDGGTLMECIIDKRVNYMRIPEMILSQRKAVHDKIKELSNSHVKHKGGLNSLKNEKGIINIAEIPGIKESGWKPPQLSEEELNALQLNLKEVILKIKDHPASWPFLKPVDRREVPDYYEVIKDPVDLELVEKRVEAGNYYITKEIFLADVKRMCENCRTYNHPETEYYKCANDLETEFVKKSFKHIKRLETDEVQIASH